MEIEHEMIIEIIELPDLICKLSKNVIRKNDPVNVPPVTKYVKNRRKRIFQNEKPIFYHTMSSGYGALSMVKSTNLLFFALNFIIRSFLQQLNLEKEVF